MYILYEMSKAATDLYQICFGKNRSEKAESPTNLHTESRLIFAHMNDATLLRCSQHLLYGLTTLLGLWGFESTEKCSCILFSLASKLSLNLETYYNAI